MQRRVYRFIPVDPEGRPRIDSRYTVTSSRLLRPGDLLHAPLGEIETWRVVELREPSGAAAFEGLRDAAGDELPIAGTVVCERAP